VVVSLFGAEARDAAASFKVFPTTVRLQRGPGQASVGTFNVALRGERGRRFRVETRDVAQQPDGSFAYVPASGSSFSASSWISASPRSFAGDPNRTQPVQFRVLVPSAAEPGDHVTSLLVERLPQGGAATTAPAEAVAVRVDIQVRGRAKPAAAITSLNVPSISGDNPVSVSAVVRNTGNVRLDFDHRNKGYLAVNSGSDRKAELGFDGLLYPGQSRSFQLSWDDPPLIGHYSAAASIELGKRVVDRSQSFYVFPWRQAGALVLIALAAAVLLIGVQRRRSNA
jgi:hypothetical protein